MDTPAPKPRLPRRTLDYLENGVSEGSRNNALFAAAQQVHDAYLETEYEAVLLQRAVADGLSEQEAKKAIKQAFNMPRREPLEGAAGDNKFCNTKFTPGKGFKHTWMDRDGPPISMIRKEEPPLHLARFFVHLFICFLRGGKRCVGSRAIAADSGDSFGSQGD